MRLLVLVAIASAILMACSGTSDKGGSAPTAIERLTAALPEEHKNAVAEAREGFQEMFGSPLLDNQDRLCETVRAISDQAAWDELTKYMREQVGSIEESRSEFGIADEAIVEEGLGAILKDECAHKY